MWGLNKRIGIGFKLRENVYQGDRQSEHDVRYGLLHNKESVNFARV